jgi:hypothetical protein
MVLPPKRAPLSLVSGPHNVSYMVSHVQKLASFALSDSTMNATQPGVESYNVAQAAIGQVSSTVSKQSMKFGSQSGPSPIHSEGLPAQT